MRRQDAGQSRAPTAELRKKFAHVSIHRAMDPLSEFSISGLDVLDRLPEAVSIIGPDGVHLHTNAAAAAILDDLSSGHEGRSISDVSWGSIDASGEPLPSERLPVEITRSTGEECSEVEVGFPAAGGGVRWLRISTRRLSDQGPPCVVIASFVDITEARQTRAELDRQRTRHQTVVESLDEGVVIDDAEGRIVAANTRAGELLGLGRDQLIGRMSLDPRLRSVHADGSPWASKDQPSPRARETGQPQRDVRMGLRTPDGAMRWLRVNATPQHALDGTVSGVVTTLLDETDKLRDSEDLARATQLFTTAFADAPVGIALVGLDGAWLKVNRALCELIGYSEAELLVRTFQEITHPEDLDADLEQVQRLVDGLIERYSMEKRYFTASGALIWVNLSVSLVTAPDGTPEHFISQIEDITKRKRLEQSLQRLADHDPLTDLWNRRRFEEELQRQVGRCRRYGEQAALFLVDLDDFKQINDTLGHKAGDDLLCAVTTAMRKRLRSTDSIARLGGDEFAVLLANVPPDRAAALAEDLVESIRSHPVRVRGREITATASIGVAFLDGSVESDESVLMAADIAMYQAKAAGRDRIRTQHLTTQPTHDNAGAVPEPELRASEGGRRALHGAESDNPASSSS